MMNDKIILSVAGFYSHLPIVKGDRVGAVICAHASNYGLTHADNPTDSGYFPIMPPVFGKYNEYLDMTGVWESNTTRLFKTVTGRDVEEFIHVCAEWGECKTEINHIGYKTFKGIVGKLSIADSERTVIDVEMYSPEIRNDMKDLQKYFDKQFENAKNCGFVVLFEHEDVIRELTDIGHGVLISKDCLGNVFDISADYDRFESIIRKFNDAIGSSLNLIVRDENEIGMFLKEHPICLDMNDRKELSDACIRFIGNCRHFALNPMLYRLYKNADELDYDTLKADFLGGLYLYSGISSMGGQFIPCKSISPKFDKGAMQRLLNLYSEEILDSKLYRRYNH